MNRIFASGLIFQFSTYAITDFKFLDPKPQNIDSKFFPLLTSQDYRLDPSD